MAQIETSERVWPALPFIGWQDTCATLHMWTQVVGKIRLALEPMVNHWWQVPLYVTATGLTTSLMPYGSRSVQIDFRFLPPCAGHHDERSATRGIRARADAGGGILRKGDGRGCAISALKCTSGPMPVEVADAVPFEQDYLHKSYDADAAHRFWRALVQIDRVMKQFRAGFTGKVSPVHFFWGSFDMAVTRFLRTHSAAASRRHAEPRQLGGARGLFARGLELLASGRGTAASARRRFIPMPIRRHLDLPMRHCVRMLPISTITCRNSSSTMTTFAHPQILTQL